MEITVKMNDDPFPEPPHVDDHPGCGGFDRRVIGSQHREARNPDPQQFPANDARPQRMEVRLDLGKFRHGETVEQ